MIEEKGSKTSSQEFVHEQSNLDRQLTFCNVHVIPKE